jgi:hypothetical protein
MTSRWKLGRRKMGRVVGVITGRRTMVRKMGKKVARMMASKTMQGMEMGMEVRSKVDQEKIQVTASQITIPEAGTTPLAAPITLQERVLWIENIPRPTTDMTTKVTTKIATRMGTWQWVLY